MIKKQEPEEIKASDILVTEEVETQEELSAPEKELEPSENEFKKQEPEVNLSPALNNLKSPSNGKKYFLIALIVIFALALVAGAVFVSRNSIKKETKIEEKAPETLVLTPTPIGTKEASPAAELKREDLKIKILNGSGVAGEAKKAKDLLEDLGYKDIKIGNANSYGYTKVEISLKEEREDYFKLLSEDLSEEYTVLKTMEVLDEAEDFDAVIILGK
jgi:hypothetical protein